MLFLGSVIGGVAGAVFGGGVGNIFGGIFGGGGGLFGSLFNLFQDLLGNLFQQRQDAANQTVARDLQQSQSHGCCCCCHRDHSSPAPQPSPSPPSPKVRVARLRATLLARARFEARSGGGRDGGGRDGGETASPLTFDLNGNGKVGTTDLQRGRSFDLDGDGRLDRTAWAERGDGVLAFDADGDGRSGTSGKELFGNFTEIAGRSYANGFEALEALAVETLGARAVADGELDARELAQLERPVAEGGAGLTMLVDGRQVRPSELGITEIDLGYREAGLNPDEHGNQHRQIGAGFVIDGDVARVSDVWFRYT